MPTSLIDCSERSDNELFVVEGVSAANAIKNSRDRRFQAVLPMQGKIPNAARTSDDRLFAHPQVTDLLQSLQTKPNTELTEFRYERVVLLNDPDADGFHAGMLLVLFLYKQVPALIEQGRLFVVRAPLYAFFRNDQRVGLAYTDSHAASVMKALAENSSEPVTRRRYKGIASLEAGVRQSLMTKDCRARMLLSMAGCEEMCRTLL